MATIVPVNSDEHVGEAGVIQNDSSWRRSTNYYYRCTTRKAAEYYYRIIFGFISDLTICTFVIQNIVQYHGKVPSR